MIDYNLGLREACDEEIEFLIQRAEKQLPQSLTVHNLLCVGFRRKLMDRAYSRIYVPRCQNAPLFIIITGVVMKPNQNNLTIFWNPNEISSENAKKLMKSLPEWDWEKPVLVSHASVPILQEVEKIMLGEDGLCNQKLHVERVVGHSYTLSAENIMYKIPDNGFILSRLSEDYASLVFKHWAYNFDTLEGVRRYMSSLPTMAAFVKVDPNEINDNQDMYIKSGNDLDEVYKPVAWTICRLFGEIGFTYTLPEYRNKGLCGAVTLALAKELLNINISPYVNITGVKPASVKSHENIGFRKYCTVGYDAYVPDGWKFEDF